eukprot:Nitzschia sp. Nitz4//scaffold18_size181773//161999//163555//NITZ4_001941-RA/size181773-processed-gene-0.29-mRNA-1//1//CDS//3329540089//4340//frame0
MGTSHIFVLLQSVLITTADCSDGSSTSPHTIAVTRTTRHSLKWYSPMQPSSNSPGDGSTTNTPTRPQDFMLRAMAPPVFPPHINAGDGLHNMALASARNLPLSFPQQLMEVLCKPELSHIISWLPHGHGWIILDKQRFADDILPEYFGKKTKWTSFTRKLNRWSFTRVTRGSEVGAYYHPLFQRDNKALCSQMTCIGSKTPQSIEPLNPVALGLATPNMISHGLSAVVQDSSSPYTGMRQVTNAPIPDESVSSADRAPTNIDPLTTMLKASTPQVQNRLIQPSSQQMGNNMSLSQEQFAQLQSSSQSQLRSLQQQLQALQARQGGQGGDSYPPTANTSNDIESTNNGQAMGPMGGGGGSSIQPMMFNLSEALAQQPQVLLNQGFLLGGMGINNVVGSGSSNLNYQGGTTANIEGGSSAGRSPGNGPQRGEESIDPRMFGPGMLQAPSGTLMGGNGGQKTQNYSMGKSMEEEGKQTAATNPQTLDNHSQRQASNKLAELMEQKNHMPS